MAPSRDALNYEAFIKDNLRRLKSPSCQTGPLTAPEPVLFGYGPSDLQAYRDATRFVDRILKGAKPGELLIEQATRFDLVGSLKAARTLGLTIPPSVLGSVPKRVENSNAFSGR